MFTAARPIIRSAPLRTAASRVAKAGQPKRGMAGGPAPQYEGFEAKVREKLPKDEQLVVAITGFYVGLYALFKAGSAVFSSPKKNVPVAATPVAAPTGDSEIPADGASDEFWAWLELEGNMEKYLATIKPE